jgi:hypothetical protein
VFLLSGAMATTAVITELHLNDVTDVLSFNITKETRIGLLKINCHREYILHLTQNFVSKI